MPSATGGAESEESLAWFTTEADTGYYCITHVKREAHSKRRDDTGEGRLQSLGAPGMFAEPIAVSSEEGGSGPGDEEGRTC